MKKSIIILLLSIPFIGFGQTQYDKSYYESGQLEYEGNFIDGKQDGLWKYYYESGQLKKKVTWKDGEVNGPKESYYESGQLEREGNYQDGEQVGLWKSYYESGQLETTRNFKEGDDIRVDGGEHYKYQDFKHYYENGKIKEEGSGMVGGEMDRLLIYQITWDENGNKTIQVDNRDNLEYEKW